MPNTFTSAHRNAQDEIVTADAQPSGEASRRPRRAAAVFVLLALISFGLSSQATEELELRVPLSKIGFEKLRTQFAKASKSRTDTYFDVLCGEDFAFGTLQPPMKLRAKEKKNAIELQLSYPLEAKTIEALGTPVQFRRSNTEEESLGDHDALMVASKEFFELAKHPSKRLLKAAENVQATFLSHKYLGSEDVAELVAHPGCRFLPKGQNTKARFSSTLLTSDGATLEIVLGETTGLTARGELEVLYELEADPTHVDRARFDPELEAQELIAFVTAGQGLAPEDLTQAQSSLGAYIKAQLRKAVSANLSGE